MARHYERRVPMMGVPHAQLDALSDALAAGPVTLDVLQTVLSHGMAGTPLACVLADELAERCVLPDTLTDTEQAAWREALLLALRLPTLAWEVAALDLRRELNPENARRHPLLRSLRDALYRPHSLDRSLWQSCLAQAPDADCHALALDYQRQLLGPRDMQARHGWAAEQLRALAPGTSDTEYERALLRMRQLEQRERGLLEPRVGLQHLIECDAASSDVVGPESPLAQAAGSAAPIPPPAPAPSALAALLCEVAAAALPAPDTVLPPLGRYDSVANALVSLLSLPAQLPDLRHWLSHSLVAGARLAGPSTPHRPSRLAAALRPLTPTAAWSTWVTTEACAPAGTRAEDVNAADQAVRRQVVDALLRQSSPQPAAGSSAVIACAPQSRLLPGLQAQQVEQILGFMRRQRPDATTPAEALRAFSSLFGRPPAMAAETAAPADSCSAVHWPVPRARAGALTDEGRMPATASGAPALLPGAGAQMFGEVSGQIPLLLIQGVIDNIRADSWWSALPGYTQHSAVGLLHSLHDLFAQAGEPLHARPPTPEALERFFGTAQGTALFNAIEQMPELSTWQQSEVERGGVEAQIYVFMRMLRQLMSTLHAHAAPNAEPARQQAHDGALYALARIGLAAGELLAEYDDHAPDAGRGYFRRTRDRTRPAAAHSPTATSTEVIERHARRVRPTPGGFCPPIDRRELRQWWAGDAHPLLSEDTFENLTDADRCLAQIAVVNSRGLLGQPPSQWREVMPTMGDWRARCDRLAADPSSPTETWEEAAGIYFHGVARMLKEWLRLQQDEPLTQDVLDLGVHLRRMIEPLQHLYSAVDLPLQEADPWYADSYAIYHRFYQRVGQQLSDPALPSEARSADVPPLSLSAWIEAVPGRALARAICPTDAVSVRDGLVEVVTRALSAAPADDSGLPPIWNLIMQGPHALQQWLESAEGRTATARWMAAVDSSHVRQGAVDPAAPVDWQTRAALLRKAVLSQLPHAAQTHMPVLDDVPTLFANGTAPVLSLAQTLATLDPMLRRDPQQALALAVALLPNAEAPNAARMPLAFPLWPGATPQAATPVTAADTDPLPTHWLPPLTAEPNTHALDTRALPDLHTLLQGWGLDVLHASTPESTLHPADLWELVSRTERFAGLGQQLLQHTDWAGAKRDDVASPQNLQRVVAQAMLERYVGRTQVDALRTQLNAPDSVHRTFVQQQALVRDAVVGRQPHASAAAIRLLEWLVLRELDQPVLLVNDIPDGLHPALLAGAVFAHSVQLLEALQPGASGRVSYAQVAGLAAELATPPASAGDKQALHNAWARAMLRPALAYAAAHGQLPGLTHLDRATPEQAQQALEFLQQAQEQHAGHMARIATAPPTRRGIAARTLGQAHVAANLWSLPVDQLPNGYLAEHGIVAAPRLDAAAQWVEVLLPMSGVNGDQPLKGVLTADDSLQNLIAADAYICTQRPTTKVLFNAAFDTYRRTVEQGLAGLIEELLLSLPPEDQALLRTSTCTPLRVKAFGQDARQGLLLRCQPQGNVEPVYFEILPGSGIARRAYLDPQLGPCVDAQGLIDGSFAVHRTERVAPVRDLTLTPLANATTMSAPGAIHTLSTGAAKPLWDVPLDKVKQQELDRATPLEQVLHKEETFLEQAAEFAIPFYACIKNAVDGKTTDAVVACAGDVLGAIVPGFKVASSMVHLAQEAGEHTLLSLAAHTGDALSTFARELAQNSGLVFLHQIGKGAVWIGGKAWTQALHGAEWLRSVVRGEHAFGAVAHGLDNVIAHGHATPELLGSLEVGDATLAVGHSGDGIPVLMVGSKDGWYRFDPIAQAGYGPRLEQVHLLAPLPAELPSELIEGGVRVHLGDATGVRFVERANNVWEVWLGETPYLLDPSDGSLRLREVHGGEPGELQEVDATGCRVRRGVESAGDSSCNRPTQLRFVPDQLVALPETPSPEHLVPHAFGYRGYTLAELSPTRELASADNDMLESLATLWPDRKRPVAPVVEQNQQVMIHEGKVQKWHVPRTKQGRPLPAKLAPLTPEEAETLGIPLQAEYLPVIEGHVVSDATLGLADTVGADERMLVNLKLPAITLGPIAAGVQDARSLRGVRMPINDTPSICIEPDRGVYYAAPVPTHSGQTLHFTRVHDRKDIANYLRYSELQRLYRENPESEQLRRNIEEMTFNYLQPGFDEEERARYATYPEFMAYCRQHGRQSQLTDFANAVLSGEPQQRAFVELSRQLIPDWKALQSCPLDEREQIAAMFNTLLPLEGKEADWVPLTGESLALPETAGRLLKHVGGANFAYVEMETTEGTRVYASLSAGERARKMKLKLPADTDQVRYVNAREAGVPPNDAFATLPVLRSPDQSRTILFPRGGDSENWIFRLILSQLESGDPAVRLAPGNIRKIKLVTLLDTCPTCGGVVAPTVKQKLAALGAEVEYSVRYLFQYVK